jgi:adenylylsulfate kinase-like enzyme
VLIVISGPIASGKSTVARALAQEVERRGATAAAIDLDVVYDMLEHDNARKDCETKWLRTRHAAATLASRFITEGIDVVIVEGDFLAAPDRADFLLSLQATEEPRFVTLRASFDDALRRVANDATRTFSRDRAFLLRHYEAAEAALRDSPPTDLLLDTGTVAADETARTIAEWALGSVGAA